MIRKNQTTVYSSSTLINKCHSALWRGAALTLTSSILVFPSDSRQRSVSFFFSRKWKHHPALHQSKDSKDKLEHINSGSPLLPFWCYWRYVLVVAYKLVSWSHQYIFCKIAVSNIVWLSLSSRRALKHTLTCFSTILICTVIKLMKMQLEVLISRVCA